MEQQKEQHTAELGQKHKSNTILSLRFPHSFVNYNPSHTQHNLHCRVAYLPAKEGIFQEIMQ